MYNSFNLQFASSLYTEIQFKVSDTALMTSRKQRYNIFTLFGALLGSIFGLMGAIGGAMAFLEKRYLIAKENYN